MKMKVFFACALGAFVGTLVALQLNHYFWWTSMLVGFATGYLAYEYKAVVATAPVAWNFACAGTKNSFSKIMAWRSSWRPCWKLYLLYLEALCLSLATLSVGVGVGLLFFLSSPLQHQIDHNQWVGWPWMICFVVPSIAGMACVIKSFCATSGWYSRPGKITALKKVRKNILYTLLLTNPIGLVVVVLGFAFAVFAVAYLLCRKLWAFACKLFFLIHSDLRLLCGTDAAIGAAIGYFLHNPLTGAVFGGMLGLLNYELVSKRWLHLVKTIE